MSAELKKQTYVTTQWIPTRYAEDAQARRTKLFLNYQTVKARERQRFRNTYRRSLSNNKTEMVSKNNTCRAFFRSKRYRKGKYKSYSQKSKLTNVENQQYNQNWFHRGYERIRYSLSHHVNIVNVYDSQLFTSSQCIFLELCQQCNAFLVVLLLW